MVTRNTGYVKEGVIVTLLDDQIAEGIAGRRFFRTIHGMFMIVCQKHCQEQITALRHGISFQRSLQCWHRNLWNLLMH